MLIGGPFEHLFRSYKFLWLRGRTGGGKTSFAFYLALSLLQDGLVERIYSNIPSVARFPKWGDCGLKSAYVIDEGGLFMKSAKDFQVVAGALRKAGNYVIISSVIPPAREFAMLSVQRSMNLASIIGVNIWVYEYELSAGATRDKGSFVWTNPKSVFGLYDTDFYPSDDGGIEEFLGDEIKKISKKANQYSRGKNKELQSEEVKSGNAPALAKGEADSLDQSAQGIEDAARRIEQAFARISKKRRF